MRRMLLSWLPWRRPLPPAIAGTVALLRLLPRVHLARTISLAVVVLLNMLLPIGLTVVTGLLIGSIPAAVEGGLDSPAARLTLTWLVVAGVAFVALWVLGPAQEVLGLALGRYLDLYLQERVIEAVGRPHGIAHLEDPDILDQIQAAQGVGMTYYRPKQAVRALATLVPRWIVPAGSALILVAFHWGVALIMLLLGALIAYFSHSELHPDSQRRLRAGGRRASRPILQRSGAHIQSRRKRCASGGCGTGWWAISNASSGTRWCRSGTSAGWGDPSSG